MRYSRVISCADPGLAGSPAVFSGQTSKSPQAWFIGRTRRPFRVLAIAVLLPLLASTANADVAYQERTEKFDIQVYGNTAMAIREAIRLKRPASFDEHTIGTTMSTMNWSRRAKVSRGECRLEKIEVQLSIVITVPAWPGRTLAPPEQQRHWDCVERTVTVHEHRHAEIWRETAQQIDRAMLMHTQPMSCSELDQNLARTYTDIHNRGKQRQAAFDAEERTNGRYEKCLPVRKNPTTAELKSRRTERHIEPTNVRQRLEAADAPLAQDPPNSPATEPRADPGVGLESAIGAIAWMVAVIGIFVAGYLGVMWAALRFKTSDGADDEVDAMAEPGFSETPAATGALPLAGDRLPARQSVVAVRTGSPSRGTFGLRKN